MRQGKSTDSKKGTMVLFAKGLIETGSRHPVRDPIAYSLLLVSASSFGMVRTRPPHPLSLDRFVLTIYISIIIRIYR